MNKGITLMAAVLALAGNSLQAVTLSLDTGPNPSYPYAYVTANLVDPGPTTSVKYFVDGFSPASGGWVKFAPDFALGLSGFPFTITPGSTHTVTAALFEGATQTQTLSGEFVITDVPDGGLTLALLGLGITTLGFGRKLVGS